MRKNCGFNVEVKRNRNIVADFFGKNRIADSFSRNFVPKVFAEEVEDKGGNNIDGGEGSNDNKPTINYEDLISKARKEEKQKQYKKIEKLETQVNSLTQQHNDDLIAIAEYKKKLDEAEKKLSKVGDGDSEEVKTLKTEIETLKADKKTLEDKVKDFEENKPVSREEVEKEVRAELEEEYKVKTYKAEKLAEHKDDLLVPELVIGSTIEEIDASLQSALERSDEIRENLGVSVEDKTTEKKPTKRTPKTPSNPSSSKVQDKKLTAEYIASLDVSSPEYAEVRKQLGLS